MFRIVADLLMSLGVAAFIGFALADSLKRLREVHPRG